NFGSFDAAAVGRNDDAAKIRVPLMVCPSDADVVPGSLYGGVSYPACAGSGINGRGNGSDDWWVNNAAGVIFSRSRIAFRDIIDGTSNTVAFGEQLLGDGQNMAPDGDDHRYRVVELPMGTQTTPAACDPAAA